MIEITDATPDDLPEITALLNEETRSGTALWTDTPLDAPARHPWFIDRQTRFAILVARAPEFAGFATYGPYRDKSGYRLTVEHSVYIPAQARGQGVARRLMEALITRARAQGFHSMIGAIESGNAASRALHQRLGFSEVGQMPQMGVKFGRWLDLTLVQLMLESGPPGTR